MRIIDADEVLKKKFRVIKPRELGVERYYVSEDDINNAPTVDAVPREEYERVCKERDAAIKDLERHCACGDCVHNYVTPFDDCNCELGVINCKWEWRGLQDG